MKIIECMGGPLTLIDGPIEIDLERSHGYWTLKLKNAGEKSQVFSATAKLPIETNVSEFELNHYAAWLVRARLAAKLSQPNCTYIPDDHEEFAICCLLEQEHYLKSAITISRARMLDWAHIVAGRTTASTILVDPPVRRFAGELYRIADNVDSTYSVIRTTIDGTHPCLVWRASDRRDCEAVLLKLQATPDKESITRIELLRWIEQHRDEFPDTPTPPVPTRSINLPQEQS